MKKLFRFICKIFCPNDLKADVSKPKTLLTYWEIVSMLHEYDKTRFEILVNGLGFEDTRINTFDFYELKNYLAYMEEEAKKKNIQLKGVSFIKGVYTEENAPKPEYVNYENLLYTPTTIINGQEVEIDVLSSTKDNIVTLKSKLEKFNYEWRYDNKENFKLKSSKKLEKKALKSIMMNDDGFSDEESGLANKTHLSPPN